MNTSEAGFIGGPWRAVRQSWGTASVYAGERGGKRVCALSIEDEATEENQDALSLQMKKTADLIAAAPDLLAACKAQHEALDYLMALLISSDTGFLPTKSPAWDAVVLGNAAIAKALGK